MSGRILDADIALVRERSPVDAVIGEHLQLRPAGGGQLKGLCPFHDEKTPSFHVSPAKALWHCFGCGEGGDVIKFVQKIDSLTFVEAVERLAARAGVQLRYQEAGPAPAREQSKKTRLAAANDAAREFYLAQLFHLPEARVARDFLRARGFDRDAAEQFSVGYAPRAWDTLAAHLRGRGFTTEELILAGLAKEGQRGPIDRFRGRLLFPVRDITGDVVGFGGRKLFDDDSGPKYLNTPETPLYKKSHLLYGVDAAKREIARRQQAVVVEGYTDVMACHLSGVTTAVATCGTSFGQEHVRLLRRLLMDQHELRGEVIFTFDGDEAGQKAALRASELEGRFVTQTYVAVQPDGLDPCELRVQRGDAAVRDLIAARVPLTEFVIRSIIERYDLDVPEGRVLALDAAAPAVAALKDEALRPEYVRRLAGWLGTEVETVAAKVFGPAVPPPGARRTTKKPPPPDDPALMVEREVLKLALQRPVLVGPAFDALDADVFVSASYAAVRDAIVAAGGASGTAAAADPDAWPRRVIDHAADLAASALVGELAVEPLHVIDSVERYADALFARLQELVATRDITELKSKLQRLNPVEEPETYNRLFGDLVVLEQHRHGLRERAIGAI